MAQNQQDMKKAHETTGVVIRKGKVIYSEIRINKPAAQVWQVFADFAAYPTWNPFIKSLTGQPEVGKRITVLLQPPGNKGMTFKPKVLRMEPSKELRWIGKLWVPYLFDGEHTFRIIDHPDSTCTFIQYERFRGLLVPLLKTMLDRDTQEGFDQMNAALKGLCEGGVSKK